MIDLTNMPEDERRLLEEVAKAKGQTLEEALVSLGHILPPKQDMKVEFVGIAAVDDKAETTPVILEPPLKIKAETSTPIEEVIPSLPSDFAVDAPPPAAETEAEEESGKKEDEELGSALHMCPQCGWDQHMPVIPEPSQFEKLGFLQMLLGQKVFSKKYLLYSGHLRLTLRSLTLREIDALYEETFRAKRMGIIATDNDFYEYLNRLRLNLQIVSLSAQNSALHITLPNGLSKETHPNAESFWDVFLAEKNRAKKATENSLTLVEQIRDYILSDVLPTEHLHRIASHTCNKFNRLVVKMEVCVDDPNFMNEIEQPA